MPELPSRVMKDLHLGIQTPDRIVHARDTQAESLQRFVEGSRELFAALSLEISLCVIASESFSHFP
jgi:hypothetical protein